MDVQISEIISGACGIVATSIGASKLFFSRLSKIEDRFSDAIEKLEKTVQELDKRLAVNSVVIKNFMENCNGSRSRRDNEIS
jgi:hypothetical protein